MLDGNTYAADHSARLGKKCLDDFGLNYFDEYQVIRYNECDEACRYRFDAYIEHRT